MLVSQPIDDTPLSRVGTIDVDEMSEDEDAA
jgi:hypothetical protein